MLTLGITGIYRCSGRHPGYFGFRSPSGIGDGFLSLQLRGECMLVYKSFFAAVRFGRGERDAKQLKSLAFFFFFVFKKKQNASVFTL